MSSVRDQDENAGGKGGREPSDQLLQNSSHDLNKVGHCGCEFVPFPGEPESHTEYLQVAAAQSVREPLCASMGLQMYLTQHYCLRSSK